MKKLNLINRKIENVLIESPTFRTSAYEYLKTLFMDENKKLWIGFWGGGLAKFDTETGKYKIWITEAGNSSSISHNDVWTIHKDKEGRLWVGTNGGGLNLFEEINGGGFHRWIDVLDKSKQLSSNSIYSICESTYEAVSTILWVGTGNGLNKIRIQNSSDLYKLDKLEIEVRSFGAQHGLADNSIKSILEDRGGNLWLGTNSGISFFDVEKEVFINYSNSDGIIGNEFNSGAAFRSEDGTMYFGNVDGLNIFHPDQIKQSSFVPPIIISDFQIFNQSMRMGGDSPLTKPIWETEEIILSYSQNVFSFQFSALDYNSPSSIQYAYQMEGFDADWINSGGRRFITYTNLNPGKYIFKVKSTNSDGVWCDNIKSISVIINPPWWRTGWAYAAYLILIITGLFFARKIENNRSKLRNELKMREFETRKQKELEIMKSRFFANLSHEFKTPLTLIRGPIEELINSKSDSNQREYLELIKRNSDKLQELIDQLLELTQLENAAIPLNKKQENIVALLSGIISSFESLAKEKNISLSFQSKSKSISCLVDIDKLEKIMNNILSNAFKFTRENGRITISLEERIIDEDKFASVKISDSGIGIPEDKLQHIFDRFYQVDDSSRKKYGGSGIGLALVKELVDLHQWQIDVKSELGEGTQFEIIIPEFNYSQNKIENKLISCDKDSIEKFEQKSLSGYDAEKFEKELEEEILEKEKLLNEKPTILVVEDSGDVRIFLKNILQNGYRIVEATDGEDGVKKAVEIIPSLVISDIMMPAMNGFELCKKIKTEIQTSHIPVILLTAKASQESKIEGFGTGADAYLTKPFSSKELLVRVKNLLEQRKKLRDKFSREVKIDASSIVVTSLDDEFLQKALAIAEQHVSDAKFNSDEFAKEMFLSRSQLHRKLIATTGQAPGEFIRIYRLKKAASFILQKKLSITQISFEVGFNSPSHFTKAFRQLFNCLPTEFIQKNN